MSTVQPLQLRAAEADSQLDHLSALDIDSEPPKVRLSGIICTLGEFTITEWPKVSADFLILVFFDTCTNFLILSSPGPACRSVDKLVSMMKVSVIFHQKIPFSHLCISGWNEHRANELFPWDS